MSPPHVQLASLDNRAQLLRDGRTIDVERRSGGRFSADVRQLLAGWPRFVEWARSQSAEPENPALDPGRLGPCVPQPSQVFGIGLNYKDHAAEANLPLPAEPMVFTKFPSCLAGPQAEVPLTGNRVDWEVELVVVIGGGGRGLSSERALEAVAGYCVGQDISDRRRQFADSPPQFNLGKSCTAFGPIGPAIVPLEDVPDPLDLGLTCEVDGERVQDGRTRDMIFAVPELVAYLSRYCELRPGDLIFTGTPAGVGSTRDPRRYLKPGQRIHSAIEGLGRLDNRCVEGPA